MTCSRHDFYLQQIFPQVFQVYAFLIALGLYLVSLSVKDFASVVNRGLMWPFSFAFLVSVRLKRPLGVAAYTVENCK